MPEFNIEECKQITISGNGLHALLKYPEGKIKEAKISFDGQNWVEFAKVQTVVELIIDRYGMELTKE